MDLFNRKKVKTLEDQLDDCQRRLEINKKLAEDLIEKSMDLFKLHTDYKYWFNVLNTHKSDLFDFEDRVIDDSIKEVCDKLDKDFCSGQRIKSISKMPDGDTYILKLFNGKSLVIFDKVLEYKDSKNGEGMRNIRVSMYEGDSSKPYYSAWVKFDTESTMSKSLADILDTVKIVKKNIGDFEDQNVSISDDENKADCDNCKCNEDDLGEKVNANEDKNKDENELKEMIKDKGTVKKGSKKGKRGRPPKKGKRGRPRKK
jgi:hypothetical protein